MAMNFIAGGSMNYYWTTGAGYARTITARFPGSNLNGDTSTNRWGATIPGDNRSCGIPGNSGNVNSWPNVGYRLDTGLLSSNYTTLCGFFVAYAAYRDNDNANLFLQIGDSAGANQHLTLYIDNNNAAGPVTCTLYRGNTTGTVLATTTLTGVGTFTRTTNVFQWGCKINATTGEFWLRINGTVIWDLTGLNTVSTANVYANRVAFGSKNGGGGVALQDVIIMDPNGSLYSTLPVDGRFALGSGGVSDASNVSNWTATGGTYPGVVQTDDADTSYISSTTPGNVNLARINTSWVPTGAVLVGPLQIAFTHRIDDATARTVQAKIRSNGVAANSSSVSPGTSYAGNAFVFSTDPNTGSAWTVSGLNAAYMGVELIT